MLVLAPLAHTFADFCSTVSVLEGIRVLPGEHGCVWQDPDLKLQLHIVGSVERACSMLEGGYFSLVVVDCRNLPHPDRDPTLQIQQMTRFLDLVSMQQDREKRYPMRRVAVLVGDDAYQRVDDVLVSLGERHVGSVIRDASLSPTLVDDDPEALRSEFVTRFWQFCRRTLLERRPGKKAIAAAGGGISGVFYELGVLKCLHDSFDTDIRDFDMYFGISGGSLVTGCLANRFPIDDLIVKLGGVDTDWPHRLRLGWRFLNVTEVPKRLLLAQREVTRYLLRTARREDDFSVASIFGTYSVLLGPIFDNSEFERVLRELFNQPGRTNDFRQLSTELYIGATDQDRREHHLFGDRDNETVPISKAIQASSAMHPFFPSVQVAGRYYTDGIITRTSNVGSAITKGADLVFVIDPFVPLISNSPGYNHDKSNMWIAEQDYKTLSYTRFEMASDEIVRQHPEVNVYTFVPSNRMRRLMSGQNPFVSRNFHQIVCEAYMSTYRRLQQLEYKIRGELRTHGITLDLAPVEAKVERLKAQKRPHVRLILDEEYSARLRRKVG
jgi:predicted acylesterase/phospholipase RssA